MDSNISFSSSIYLEQETREDEELIGVYSGGRGRVWSTTGPPFGKRLA
jgi:hypothetical protein